VIIPVIVGVAMFLADVDAVPIVIVPDQADPRCPQAQLWIEDECVNRPKLIKRKLPKYPGMAARAKVQGSVEVTFVIQPDGTTGDIRVTKPASATPNLGFEEEAIKAVEKWRYEPVSHHGKPVKLQAKATVDFSLTN
jgi:TonB family protein